MGIVAFFFEEDRFIFLLFKLLGIIFVLLIPCIFLNPLYQATNALGTM